MADEKRRAKGKKRQLATSPLVTIAAWRSLKESHIEPSSRLACDPNSESTIVQSKENPPRGELQIVTAVGLLPRDIDVAGFRKHPQGPEGDDARDHHVIGRGQRAHDTK